MSVIYQPDGRLEDRVGEYLVPALYRGGPGTLTQSPLLVKKRKLLQTKVNY